MAAVVYTLCALTSALCTWLLLRGYLASRARLLLWSSICFAGLALNNVILFLDEIVVMSVDLSVPRLGSALLGIVVLLGGLIWEAD